MHLLDCLRTKLSYSDTILCSNLVLRYYILYYLSLGRCNCELQMTHGWTRELLLSIFKRPIAAWGPGKSPCARMREGCKILCNIMGRKYLEGRGINSQSQGTILGQRLCELHSHRNGYRPLKAPGQIVTVNYKLDKCWKKNFGYAVAFKVDGNLCCKSVTPFKEYPFVRLYVWNKDCVDSQIYLYGK